MNLKQQTNIRFEPVFNIVSDIFGQAIPFMTIPGT